MDIIELIIFISVLLVSIHFFKYLYLDIFINFIQVPIMGIQAFFLPSPLAVGIRGGISAFTQATYQLFIIIMLFYIIFYLIYLLIVEVLLKLYPIFFLFPLFNAILESSPFPQLIKYGVFRLIDGIIDAFKVKDFIITILRINVSVYIFSKENIRTLFNYLFPGLGDKVIEMIKKKKKENEINKEKDEEKRDITKKKEEIKKDIITKKINEETENCISTNLIQITPDMNTTEKTKASFTNSIIKIRCNSENIGKYIRSNY